MQGWVAIYRCGDDGSATLLGASDNPKAVQTAARELLQDQAPPGDDPLDRARHKALRQLAGAGA